MFAHVISKKFASALTAAAVIAAPLVAAPAHAASDQAAPFQVDRTLIVEMADLDLDTQEGQRKLRKRVRGAARNVCGNGNSRMLALRMSYNDCVRTALKRSETQVANAIDDSRYGG